MQRSRFLKVIDLANACFKTNIAGKMGEQYEGISWFDFLFFIVHCRKRRSVSYESYILPTYFITLLSQKV